MTSVDWDRLESKYGARLIPNPRGTPEGRAATALLAMVRGVSEFGGCFAARGGGSKYKHMHRYVQCFSEIPFTVLSGEHAPSEALKQLSKLPKSKREYAQPDGVVVVRKGKTEWKAIVEVKVGSARLSHDPKQVAEYHQQAASLGFDALITISNEPARPNGQVPRGLEGAIDGRRARRCPVIHIQWRDLLGDAQALVDQELEENVADEDQAWMLMEWIRFVTDEASGILERSTLGPCWTDVLQEAEQSKLSNRSEPLQDVVRHWIGYFGEVGYHLRLLGIHVEPRIRRREKDDNELLVRRLCDHCVNQGILLAEWKIPGPIPSIDCGVHLGHRKIHVSFTVSEFDGRTAAGRIMQWVSQFDRERAPEDLRLEIGWKGTRTTTALYLREIEGTLQLQKQLQALGVDRAAIPTRMTAEWIVSLPRKRGQQGSAHLEAVTSTVVRFYEGVAAGLRSVERTPTPHGRSASTVDSIDSRPSGADVTGAADESAS